MDKIEDFMNRLTDMDGGWWPVLSLHPAKDKYIDNVLLLKSSLVFGSVVGVILLSAIAVSTGTMTLGVFLSCSITGWLLYFVINKITFVYFWNRRARRLRG